MHYTTGNKKRLCYSSDACPQEIKNKKKEKRKKGLYFDT